MDKCFKRHLLHVLLYVYNNNYTSYVYLFSHITRTNLHTALSSFTVFSCFICMFSELCTVSYQVAREGAHRRINIGLCHKIV
jgi:hypothetical protein